MKGLTLVYQPLSILVVIAWFSVVQAQQDDAVSDEARSTAAQAEAQPADDDVRDSDGSGHERGDRFSKRPGGDRDGDGEGISKEDGERLRRLLQEVWDDPAVVESREQVRVASENMRRVLRNRVMQVDPEAAALMEKFLDRSRFQDGGGEPGGRGPGGRPPRPDSQHAGLEYMARPPVYASLSDEEKAIYDAAYKQALEGEELSAIVEELTKLRDEDEALRKRRIQQFGKARAALVDAMVAADPRVGEFFRRRENGEDRRRGGGGEGEADRVRDHDREGKPDQP